MWNRTTAADYQTKFGRKHSNQNPKGVDWVISWQTLVINPLTFPAAWGWPLQGLNSYRLQASKSARGCAVLEGKVYSNQ